METINDPSAMPESYYKNSASGYFDRRTFVKVVCTETNRGRPNPKKRFI